MTERASEWRCASVRSREAIERRARRHDEMPRGLTSGSGRAPARVQSSIVSSCALTRSAGRNSAMKWVVTRTSAPSCVCPTKRMRVCRREVHRLNSIFGLTHCPARSAEQRRRTNATMQIVSRLSLLVQLRLLTFVLYPHTKRTEPRCRCPRFLCRIRLPYERI